MATHNDYVYLVSILPFNKSDFDHQDAKEEVLGKKGIAGLLEDNESNSIK